MSAGSGEHGQCGGRQARLAAEQAAAAAPGAPDPARRRWSAFVVLLVGGGIGFQAWRTSRAPTAAPTVVPVSATPVTIVDGQPIVFGSADAPGHDRACTRTSTARTAPSSRSSTRRAQRRPAARPGGGSSSTRCPSSTRARSRPATRMACAAEAGFGAATTPGCSPTRPCEWNDEQLHRAGRSQWAHRPSGVPTSCVTEPGARRWVDSINAAADAAGVTGTPTLFLDGKPVDVAQLDAGRRSTTMIADAAELRRTSRCTPCSPSPARAQSVWDDRRLPAAGVRAVHHRRHHRGDDHRHPALAGPRRQQRQPGDGGRGRGAVRHRRGPALSRDHRLRSSTSGPGGIRWTP